MEIEVICIPDKMDIVKTAAIAKTAYHSENYIAFENTSYEDASKFLEALIKRKHTSAIEPLQFIFNINGISRVLTHQLVRNRIGFSYMQKSNRRRRKCDAKSIILRNDDNRSVYEDIAEYCIKKYNYLIDVCGEDPDEARRIIPPGLPTEITFTCNARSLRHFLRFRLDKRANWEIRKMAAKIVAILIAEDLAFLIRDILEDFNKKVKK